MKSMKHFGTILATAVGLLVLAGAPAGAVGTSTSAPQTFNAALVPVNPSAAGQIEGVLRIRITPDGFINGYYRMDDRGGAMRPVVGGLQGERIWLDIGSGFNAMHVDGTYDNGKIVGYTHVLAPWRGDPRYPWQYRFVADVTSAPQS
jgi:hypothetical protein